MNEKIKECLEMKKELIMQISTDRKSIVTLKERKAIAKPQLWEEATGTVDQKKDYIRAHTASIEANIQILEANIELNYNKIKILDDEIEWEFITDE